MTLPCDCSLSKLLSACCCLLCLQQGKGAGKGGDSGKVRREGLEGEEGGGGTGGARSHSDRWRPVAFYWGFAGSTAHQNQRAETFVTAGKGLHVNQAATVHSSLSPPRCPFLLLALPRPLHSCLQVNEEVITTESEHRPQPGPRCPPPTHTHLPLPIHHQLPCC